MPTFDLTVTRHFAAPVDLVWKAWSNGADVKEWWGPTGFICPLAEMDFREGGSSFVCMRAPKEYGGRDIYNIWTYEKIIPQESIVFVLYFTDQNRTKFKPAELGMPPGIPDSVRHVVTFAAAEGGTMLTVSESGYTTAEAREISRQGLEPCLDKMTALLRKQQGV